MGTLFHSQQCAARVSFALRFFLQSSSSFPNNRLRTIFPFLKSELGPGDIIEGSTVFLVSACTKQSIFYNSSLPSPCSLYSALPADT